MEGDDSTRPHPLGVWTLQVYGPFGWEGVGVLFLDPDGVRGGGNNHYSRGRWSDGENQLRVDIDVRYFGKPRTLFGVAERTLSLRFVGELSAADDETVNGDLSRPNIDELPITARLVRCD